MKNVTVCYNQSIAAIYKETGVNIDFSAPTVKRIGELLEKFIQNIH
jgi:oligoendopeptidase F